MSVGWIFILGLALLFVLGAVTHNRLARDYRNRLDARIQTVAWVWAFSSVHFILDFKKSEQLEIRTVSS